MVYIMKSLHLSNLAALGLSFFGILVSQNATAATNAKMEFQILIDTNQLHASEAADPRLSELASDGVWAITENSPDIPQSAWPGILQALNGQKWTVTEDAPTGSSLDYTLVSSALAQITNDPSRHADASMNYFEGIALPYTMTILTPAEIQYMTLAHGNSIVVLTRGYQPGDPKREAVNLALQNPLVSGVAFEITSGMDLATSFINEGITYCLSQSGKKCYAILPPNISHQNYTADVEGFINYFAQGGFLTNPNFYVVLAVYARGNNVGFIEPDAGTAYNTVLAAANYLKQYRDLPYTAPAPETVPNGPIAPGWWDVQNVIGHVDGVSANQDGSFAVTGWTCQIFWSLPLSVNLYWDAAPAQGGTLIGTYAASDVLSEAAINIYDCGINFNLDPPYTYRFNIPLTAAAASANRGRSIYVEGVATLPGFTNQILGSVKLPGIASTSSGSSGTAAAASGTITALPCMFEQTKSVCTRQLNWTSTNATNVAVYANGVATGAVGPNGSVYAPAISPQGEVYELRSDQGTLASATVAPQPSPTPSATPSLTSNPGQVAIYRFFRPATGEHFFTATLSEGVKAGGFILEGNPFSLLSAQAPGSVPVYRCFMNGMHFISLSSVCELAPRATNEGQYGWIYTTQVSGTEPLYRLRNDRISDHIETLNSNEGYGVGYVLDGVLGYVNPQ